ncbi:MAG: hypothetical protein CME66_06235 [Halobacteriovoraceae bacterium]|nr:hypothetical protein [Halobacteriovoraceae bacterium]
MKNDLTLRKLKKTDFFKVYETFLIKKNPSQDRCFVLLKMAIMFLRSNDEHLRNLGYRICVLYGNKKGDFAPLYDVAFNLGYFPIVRLIENKTELIGKEDSFFSMFQSSFLRNFENNEYTETFQQSDMKEKLDLSIKGESFAVIAPTSYGKSELIEEVVGLNGPSCILVPTKALLAQTKRRILKKKSDKYIMTHPEMPLPQDISKLVCIFTQERLIRLLQENEDIRFDYLFVDEAHNLLADNDRSRLLAVSVMMMKHKNDDLTSVYLTPFLKTPDNLRADGDDENYNELKISESLKTERYFYCDLEGENYIYAYDQYLDREIPIKANPYKGYEEFVAKVSRKKNIVYFNRPIKAQFFAKELAKQYPKIESNELKEAIKHIKEFTHKDYDLIYCLERGVVFHHGSMQDSIKLFIEYLYTNIKEMRFIITTSTLLEGVNIPAEAMFILDNRKGLRKLSPSQFKNLVGRACRFSEVFNHQNGDLKLLEPRIFLVGTKYMRMKTKLKNFLSETVKVDRKIKDSPENVMLKNVEIDESNQQKYDDYVDFVHNLDESLYSDPNIKVASTEFGKNCFKNNIFELEIFEVEEECQKEIDSLISRGEKLNDSMKILDLISSLFLKKIKQDDEDRHRSLLRLTEVGARNFYKMLLDWRIKNTSLKQMIWLFMKYWKELKDTAVEDDDGKLHAWVYAGKWGEVAREGSYRERWVDIIEKGPVELVNLAIVKIKDEFDFIENTIMKFIEVLNLYELIDEEIYTKIKYGTSDKSKIVMIKSGMSLALVNLIESNYSKFVNVDSNSEIVSVSNKIETKMIENGENIVLINEVRFHISK